mmetsp:Transcript_5912/g.10520  ORF Transcript_5912/g.10520 Transcript_5912/m.10520 type:complete len:244 (-) Transcript_5912:33-764(-)
MSMSDAINRIVVIMAWGRRVFAEFMGTLILSYGVINSKGDAFSAAGSLWVAMGSTAMISGAHFNPAVTLGVVLVKTYLKKLSREELQELLMYVGVQFLGAWVGALLSWATKGFTWTMEPDESFTSGEAFLAEMMITSTLVMSALMVGELPDSNLVQVGVVAMALFAGAHSVGYITGACFNPAIGFAANTTDTINKGLSKMKYIWIYLIAPSTGGAIAAGIHLIYRPALASSEKVGYDTLHANT